MPVLNNLVAIIAGASSGIGYATAGLYPMRRIAAPEEMAKSVLYLASDASTFTTGTALLVEGGISINRT